MDIIDVGLYASYLLIVLCAIAAIVIPLAQSFGDPQSLVKSGIGLGVILVVFLVSYGIADSSTSSIDKAFRFSGLFKVIRALPSSTW